MLEDIRRAMSHQREAKEKAKLRKLEKERRLSYIRMGRLEERKSSEVGLREQLGSELTARRAAQASLEERRQTERELRAARGPGTGMRVARGVGRITKGVFYDIPIKSARLASKLGKGRNIQKVLIGDTALVFGPSAKQQPRSGTPQPLNEFLFGSSKRRPTSEGDPFRDILE